MRSECGRTRRAAPFGVPHNDMIGACTRQAVGSVGYWVVGMDIPVKKMVEYYLLSWIQQVGYGL